MIDLLTMVYFTSNKFLMGINKGFNTLLDMAGNKPMTDFDGFTV